MNGGFQDEPTNRLGPVVPSEDFRMGPLQRRHQPAPYHPAAQPTGYMTPYQLTPYGGWPAPPPTREVTKARKQTRHGLHLVLTFCTLGAWAVTGWPIAWAWNTFGPRSKTVTRRR